MKRRNLLSGLASFPFATAVAVTAASAHQPSSITNLAEMAVALRDRMTVAEYFSFREVAAALEGIAERTGISLQTTVRTYCKLRRATNDSGIEITPHVDALILTYTERLRNA